MNKVAVVLPVFNEADTINECFERISRTAEQNPNFNFTLYPYNDGSTDGSFESIRAASQKFWGSNIKIDPYGSTENLGLVQTLKTAYKIAINGGADFVVKTDTDADFHQDEILNRFLEYTGINTHLAVGVLKRDFKPEDNPYEYARMLQTRLLFCEYMPDLVDLDPVSCGSQFFQASELDLLLNDHRIKNHIQRWGLDPLMALVAAGHKMNVNIEHVGGENYNPARRGYNPKTKEYIPGGALDKVMSQYDSYAGIVASFLKNDDGSPKAAKDIDPYVGKPIEDLGFKMRLAA